jgi:hypothetical protein
MKKLILGLFVLISITAKAQTSFKLSVTANTIELINSVTNVTKFKAVNVGSVIFTQHPTTPAYSSFTITSQGSVNTFSYGQITLVSYSGGAYAAPVSETALLTNIKNIAVVPSAGGGGGGGGDASAANQTTQLLTMTDGTQKTQITNGTIDAALTNGATAAVTAQNALVTQISPNSPDGKSMIIESGLMGTGSVTTTANLLNASSTSLASDLTNSTYGGVINTHQMARSISAYVKFDAAATGGAIIVVGSNDNSNYKILPFWAGTATQNMTYGYTYTVSGANHYFKFNTSFRYVKLYVNSNITGVTDVSCFSVVSPFELNEKTNNLSDGITSVAIKAAVTSATSNDGSLVTQESPNTQNGSSFTVTGNTAHTTAGIFGTGANLLAGTLNNASSTNLSTYGTLVNTGANSKQWNSFVTQINTNASVTGGTVVFEGSNDGTTFKPLFISVDGALPTYLPVTLAASSAIMVSGNCDYKFINIRLATLTGGGASVGGVTNFSSTKVNLNNNPITLASTYAAFTDKAITVTERRETAVFGTNTPTVDEITTNGNTITTTNVIFLSIENMSTTTDATFSYGGRSYTLGYKGNPTGIPTYYSFDANYDAASKKYSPLANLVVSGLLSSVYVSKTFAQ